VTENVSELESKELGIKVVITYDTVLYDVSEIEDIDTMIAGVMEAWHRRREFALARPKLYGVTVH
jgi:hypothetical protein